MFETFSSAEFVTISYSLAGVSLLLCALYHVFRYRFWKQRHQSLQTEKKQHGA